MRKKRLASSASSGLRCFSIAVRSKSCCSGATAASVPCCWVLKISCAAWDTASRSGFLAAVITAAVCVSTACAVSPGGAVFSASFTCLAACAVESGVGCTAATSSTFKPLVAAFNSPTMASAFSGESTSERASRKALRTGLASAFCSGEGISQGDVGVSPTFCSGATPAEAGGFSAWSSGGFVLSGLSLAALPEGLSVAFRLSGMGG